MNPKITDYGVLFEPTHERIVDAVVKLIREGFQPLGGIAVGVHDEGVIFVQAVVRYSESDTAEKKPDANPANS